MRRPKSKNLHRSPPNPDALFDRILAEVRARAARQARVVQRVIADSADPRTAVLGSAAALAALDAGLADEILATSRYVESEAASMPALLALAAARNVRVISVGGMAALQLDLWANGIAASLRRDRRALRAAH